MGRGFALLALSPLQAGKASVQSTFETFCNRWSWGVRSLVQSANSLAQSVGLAAGRYQMMDEQAKNALKEVYSHLFSNPHLKPRIVHRQRPGADRYQCVAQSWSGKPKFGCRPRALRRRHGRGRSDPRPTRRSSPLCCLPGRYRPSGRNPVRRNAFRTLAPATSNRRDTPLAGRRGQRGHYRRHRRFLRHLVACSSYRNGDPRRRTITRSVNGHVPGRRT